MLHRQFEMQFGKAIVKFTAVRGARASGSPSLRDIDDVSINQACFCAFGKKKPQGQNNSIF